MMHTIRYAGGSCRVRGDDDYRERFERALRLYHARRMPLAVAADTAGVSINALRYAAVKLGIARCRRQGQLLRWYGGSDGKDRRDRVAEAARLLADGLPAKKVARRTGYESKSGLYKAVKRGLEYGIVPYAPEAVYDRPYQAAACGDGHGGEPEVA